MPLVPVVCQRMRRGHLARNLRPLTGVPQLTALNSRPGVYGVTAIGQGFPSLVCPHLGREATIHSIRHLTDRKAFRCIEGNLLGAPRCMPLQSVSSRRNDAGRYYRHPDAIGAMKLDARPATNFSLLFFHSPPLTGAGSKSRSARTARLFDFAAGPM
jgi:hypothetical protein